MRIQVWGNKMKKKEEDPDYVVFQKQRTNEIEGKSYETVEIGAGWKMEAPSGEIYLDVKIDGLTNNKPKL